MLVPLFVISTIFLYGPSPTSAAGNELWVWSCNQGNCLRALNNATTVTSPNGIYYPSVEVCRLVCGQYAALLPFPTIQTVMSTNLLTFDPSKIAVTTSTPSTTTATLLDQMVHIFLNGLDTTTNCGSTLSQVNIAITIGTDTSVILWSTDETYNLQISGTQDLPISVAIQAQTIFGARHALTTLSQMIELYEYSGPDPIPVTCLVIVDTAQIADGPKFPHRGLLLDTSRNFQSLPQLKRHVDAMGASKLNVLHWHVTDSHSFPLSIPSQPNMTKYGAYTDEMIYTATDTQDLIQYAKLRGVQILFEIDGPSHAGNGWQWGADAGLGDLALCVNAKVWRSYCIEPPCGQMNPINPNLYTVLGQIYGDIYSWLPMYQPFHMGADEVTMNCWNSTVDILNYLAVRNLTRNTTSFQNLWGSYQNQALAALDTAVGHSATPIIVWSSDLTQPTVIQQYFSKSRYVIQTWVSNTDPLSTNLINLGYNIILSTKNTWYLDHGFWGGTIYHDWRTVYNNKLPANGTIGGEVCMWGEYVDEKVVETRTWPRAAAFAERMWSNPVNTSKQAEVRMPRHRERLVKMGVSAEAILPRWCYENESACL